MFEGKFENISSIAAHLKYRSCTKPHRQQTTQIAKLSPYALRVKHSNKSAHYIDRIKLEPLNANLPKNFGKFHCPLHVHKCPVKILPKKNNLPRPLYQKSMDKSRRFDCPLHVYFNPVKIFICPPNVQKLATKLD